jgi:hypothetical protein
MGRLIWIVFLGGMMVSLFYGGPRGKMIYLVAVGVILAVFRRPLVLGLTHLAAHLGFTRKMIQQMPSAIRLVRAEQPTEAARPILDALAACQFIDAGSYTIEELPKIRVSLMVQPEQGLLAAVESASSIGAHVNLHTLYRDGQVVTFTNSKLPSSRLPPNISCTRLPGTSPAALVTRARNQRPNASIRQISVEEAPHLYEQLYTDCVQFQKAASA